MSAGKVLHLLCSLSQWQIALASQTLIRNLHEGLEDRNVRTELTAYTLFAEDLVNIENLSV